MKVLVPVLSQKEASPEFIERLSSKAKEIIVLLVIDTKAMSGQFGFAAGEIAHANALMQQLKEAIGKKKKTCEDLMEWGDTFTKIEHTAMLKQADKIILVWQDNQFFKKLLKDLKEKLPKIEIETVKLEEEK
ncbi:MAG: universal stress protein [Candidatus Diapherotrites archaeon]|uniref:Universal stress protein n=1 Tax=Candidatus Iainarchaeum sp. TaxID=3101447 RepID=A0A939C6R8_9ARCH|nr:universal stress protein [Candidatus Diapherotrites archaeon]